jgi:hypothetical protein
MSKCTKLFVLLLVIVQLAHGFQFFPLHVAQRGSSTALSMGFFSRFRRNKGGEEPVQAADVPTLQQPVVSQPAVAGDDISTYWNRPGPWDDRNLGRCRLQVHFDWMARSQEC